MGLELMPFHLPMCITDTQIRTQSLKDTSHFSQSMDAVKNKENLSSPLCFIIDRISYEIFVVPMHFSLDGLTIGRGGIYYTKISCPHQTELQRSWNRCGS